MDRSKTSVPDHSAAVRTAGSVTLDLVLPAATREHGELASAPAARPVVREASVFRQPQNGCRTESEPHAHPAADAHSGPRSPLSETEPESSGAGSPDLSVPAAWRGNSPAQPRLEHGYYLHSDARRLSVPGRGDGLVQPLRAQLGTFQHHGDRLLSGGAQRRFPLRPARNLELRSGLPVHLGRFPGSTQKARDRDQHGWPRSRPRQRVHRAVVALTQIRTDLPRRLRHRARSVSGPGRLLPLLQSPAPAPGARVSDAGRPVPAQTQKEAVIVIMGALPPTPRDLTLLFSRMDAFCFTEKRTCLTIEMLDRRIGQRRDATRAPIQARNGWRPHGRRLTQPATPSKDWRNFVQTMGSTSHLAITCSDFHRKSAIGSLPT